ncbi:MAG: hypothetical protein ACRDL6_01875, partial [Solirubrobacterales bacterium]
MSGFRAYRLGRRPGRGSRLRLAAAALALVASCALAGRAGAQAQGGDCPGTENFEGQACVMMIQVDGLEATDVTQEKTPFLWELAHPDGPPTGTSSPAMQGRNGWIWQAPRASMSAGLGANAASFLIGGYAEQTGVPADDFRRAPPSAPIDPQEDGERIRLGGSAVDSNIGSASSGDLRAASLFQLVGEQLDDGAETAAFVGDPNLGPLVTGLVDEQGNHPDVDIGWYPTATSSGNPPNPDNPQNPALCDIPRTPVPPDPSPESELPPCAASDEMTLSTAFQELNSNGDAVALTYIELAELGRVRRAGASAAEVASTLQKTDAALATFFNGYNSPACETCQDKWGSTIVMLAGTSGYE